MNTKTSILVIIIAGLALAFGIGSYAHDGSPNRDQQGYYGQNYSGMGHHSGGMGMRGRHMGGGGWFGFMHNDSDNRYEGMRHNPANMMGKNIDPDAIKDKLDLTEPQIPAWQIWKDTIDTQLEIRDKHHDEMRTLFEDRDTFDPVNHGNQRIEFMEKNIQQLKITNQTFQDFYQTLTPKQQEALTPEQQRGFKGRRSGYCFE